MKKILLTALALLSLNAHAGYTQYKLTGPGVSNSIYGDASLVVRDEDRSVVFYSLGTDYGRFAPQEVGDRYTRGWLIDSSISFAGAPTNMQMRNMQMEGYENMAWLDFTQESSPGMFDYTFRIVSRPSAYTPYPNAFPRVEVTYQGTASVAQMSDDLSALLPYEQYELPHIAPRLLYMSQPEGKPLPEPSSIALAFIGLCGFIGARRKFR